MKNKKRFGSFVICCLMVFCFAGCEKRKDMEDSSYVLALGVEKTGKKYFVRYSYADFERQKSNGGINIPSKSITISGTSFADTNRKWAQTQKLNFGHLKVVIFGNGRKDPKIVRELLNNPQIAKSVFVLETNRPISEVFEIEKKLPVSFGEYVVKAIENTGKISSPKNRTLGRIMY